VEPFKPLHKYPKPTQYENIRTLFKQLQTAIKQEVTHFMLFKISELLSDGNSQPDSECNTASILYTKLLSVPWVVGAGVCCDSCDRRSQKPCSCDQQALIGTLCQSSLMAIRLAIEHNILLHKITHCSNPLSWGVSIFEQHI
jgi:hypothetical protein